MDYQEVIEVLNNHERYVGVKYVNGIEEAYVTPYFEKALNTAISAMQELQEYKQLGTLEEVREAVEKHKWIPCSERLPEESGKYEVTALDAGRLIVTLVKWQPKLKSWNLTGAMAYWKITAWRPLPEPYNPERSNT